MNIMKYVIYIIYLGYVKEYESTLWVQEIMEYEFNSHNFYFYFLYIVIFWIICNTCISFITMHSNNGIRAYHVLTRDKIPQVCPHGFLLHLCVKKPHEC